VDEVGTQERVWAFDGRVLELFNFPGEAGGARFHTALMALEVSGPIDSEGRMKIVLRYFREKRGGISEIVEAEDYARLHPLLERVHGALR
jgi:hypothetical protein